MSSSIFLPPLIISQNLKIRAPRSSVLHGVSYGGNLDISRQQPERLKRVRGITDNSNEGQFRWQAKMGGRPQAQSF